MTGRRSAETRRAKPQESQGRKFIETARELGCNEDPEAFERAVRNVARPQRGEPVPSNLRAKRTATKRRLKEAPEDGR
jgi:hypothetical protein